MGVVIETFLQCDSCGDTFGVDNRSDTGKEHRKNAKGNGWVYSGGKDYCNYCKKGGKEIKPKSFNPYHKD